MQKINNFSNVAKDWRWLKLVVLFWIIIGGLPMIIFNPKDTSTIAIILVVALLVAIAATAFCIKCYVFYVQEVQKQTESQNFLKDEVDAPNQTQADTRNSP